MNVAMRKPSGDDGAQIWTIIREIPGLDLNSPYCYLLLADHFADSCVLAEAGGTLVGVVLAYRKPRDPTTLFVWQVAVADTHRGRGIGHAMLEHLVATVAPESVEATVGPSNHASRRMFQALARTCGGAFDVRPWLTPDDFPEPGHEAEELIRIGPIPTPGTDARCHRGSLDNRARMANS